MEIILLENIQNLGELGDVVQVRSGYARNYLVPQGKAVWATQDAKGQVEERRKELAKLDSERMDAAKAKIDLLPASKQIRSEAGVLITLDSTRAAHSNWPGFFDP